MSDRIFGALALVLAGLMAWATTLIEESFIQDPLGPKAFPLLIAGVMAVAGAVMVWRPDASPQWPALAKRLELLLTLGVLVAYAQLLPVLGFVLSTIGLTAFLCGRLGATLRQSLQGGVLIALGVYALFQHVLGLHLATGPWGF